MLICRDCGSPGQELIRRSSHALGALLLWSDAVLVPIEAEEKCSMMLPMPALYLQQMTTSTMAPWECSHSSMIVSIILGSIEVMNEYMYAHLMTLHGSMVWMLCANSQLQILGLAEAAVALVR